MAAEWYFKNKPLLWSFMHPTKKSLNNIDFYLLTFLMELPYNKVLAHKQDVHAGHLCTLCILCAYLQSAHLQIMVWSLNSMQ